MEKITYCIKCYSPNTISFETYIECNQCGFIFTHQEVIEE